MTVNGEHLLETVALFIGLLVVAVAVAILARPLRLPDTVALVVAGLGIGAVADPLGFAKELEVPPELVLLVLLPGLVFEAAYRLRIADLRRWFGALLLLAIPGVLVSAVVVALVLSVGTGLPFVARVRRRGDGLRDRSRGGRRHVQAPARLPLPRDDGRRREPAQRRDRPGAVRHRHPGGVGAGHGGRGSARLRRRGDRERRDRSRRRRDRGAGHVDRRRPPHRADDLGHRRLRRVPGGGVVPLLGGHRHRHGGDRARQRRAGPRAQRRRHRCHRHRLGVPRLPADRGRVPARRARDPTCRAARGGRADRAGHRGHPHRPGDRHVRPDRPDVADQGRSGVRRADPAPVARRPLLVRPARSRRRRDGVGPATRPAAAGIASGGRLRGRAVHAAGPGDDDRTTRAAGPGRPVRRRRRNRRSRSPAPPDQVAAPARVTTRRGSAGC